MHSAQNDYLETEVLTATPEKLQLMLIEGAIRMVHKARSCRQAGEANAASDALIRGQQIVAEMISGLNTSAQPELAGRIAAVYAFVYRTLIAANFEHNDSRLDEALRILNIERETWRMLCQRTARQAAPRGGADFPSSHGQSFVA